MQQNRILRIVVTVVALLLAAAHFSNPEFVLDTVTIVLLIVAALPWAQPLIKSVELFGVKLELQELKAQLSEAKEDLSEAKGAAESAERKADYLLLGTTAPSRERDDPKLMDKGDESFVQQMRAYEQIRETQPSGAGRTQAMTEIVRKMIELTPFLRSFDVADSLMSGERGRRLAAYAYLYARPALDLIEPLVTSVTKLEDKPFGQYWGLQAISRVLMTRGSEPVPDRVLVRLRQYAERVSRGTDRDYEIRKILRELELEPVRGEASRR
jgi:hypothetical protein